MDLSEDTEHVQKAMREHPHIGVRLIAARLGWIHANGRTMDWRVIRALEALALDKRAVVRDGKWRLIS